MMFNAMDVVRTEKDGMGGQLVDVADPFVGLFILLHVVNSDPSRPNGVPKSQKSEERKGGRIVR